MLAHVESYYTCSQKRKHISRALCKILRAQTISIGFVHNVRTCTPGSFHRTLQCGCIHGSNLPLTPLATSGEPGFTHSTPDVVHLQACCAARYRIRFVCVCVCPQQTLFMLAIETRFVRRRWAVSNISSVVPLSARKMAQLFPSVSSKYKLMLWWWQSRSRASSDCVCMFSSISLNVSRAHRTELLLKVGCFPL